MCLIGLLLPFKDKEYKKHKSRSTGHSHSERPRREKSSRRETEDSERHRERSHRREQDPERSHRERPRRREKEELERPHRERSRREEKDIESPYRERSDREKDDFERPHRQRSRQREQEEAKNSRAVAEDALALLCLSLEQSLLEEQQRWREQDMLDRSELYRLGLERGRIPPSEEAPPYSLRDEAAARQPTRAEPQHQKGVADSAAPCPRNGDSSVGSTAICCRNCVCTRCGSAIIKCPTVPELDDTRVRAFTESGADSRRRRAQPAGGPHAP